MTDINSAQLDQIKARLERVYRKSQYLTLERTDRNQEVLSKLTLNLILEWARALPPETIVGETVRLKNCPIHRYLKDAGFNVYFVSPNTILGEGFNLAHSEFPLFISELICMIDERGGGTGQAVTARRLASLVEEVSPYNQRQL